jgi:hypothetical protein
MAGYAKLFGSILFSTIWGESKDVKILWITMMAMADPDGMVEAAVPGLAAASRLTVEECRTALAVLEAPDPDSKNPAYEGRRIAKRDGGWLLLNYSTYRDKLTLAHKREKTAERVRKYRERNAQKEPAVAPPADPPDDFNGSPNETICPANLLEQATPKVLPELAAKLRGSTLEQVSLSAGRMVAHYVIGKGMGQKRRFWMRELRNWVTKDHGSNKLANGTKAPRNVGAMLTERAERMAREAREREAAE